MSAPRFTTSRFDERRLTTLPHRIERRSDMYRLRTHGAVQPMQDDPAPTWANILMWSSAGIGAAGVLHMILRTIGAY